MTDLLANIASSVGVAVTVSLSTYVSKGMKGESFSPKKMLRTVLIGGIAGVVNSISGYNITPENYQTYITANAGVVSVADQLIKAGFRIKF